MSAGHVTVRVAAERLGVCRRTIERRIRSGQLAAVDVNKGGRAARWRIPVAELERLTFTPPAVEADVQAARVGPPAPLPPDVVQRSGKPFQVRARRAAA